MSWAALIVDVDGVVSPVHPARSTWGDEVQAGHLFGPVMLSPQLCTRLDALADRPGVTAAWLTDWTAQMRDGLDPRPGHNWPDIPELPADTQQSEGIGWWKHASLARWLEDRPHITAVVWCDDHLTPLRGDAFRRRLEPAGLATLLVAPETEVGLTEADLESIDAFLRQHAARHRADNASHREDGKR